MTKEEYFIESRDAFYTLNDLKKYNIPKEVYDNICAQFYTLGTSYNEQPSLPSNLDEAANSYSSKTECAVVACRGFKAGAEWMAGQGETIDGEIISTSDYGWETIRIPKKLYPLGTKVTVQIRKK